MNWRDQLNKAVGSLKTAAESENVRNVTTKARDTAKGLAQKVRQGAVNAADAFVEAESDKSALRVRYLNADFSVVSPSDGLEVARPGAGMLTVTDGAGNGLVINAGAAKAVVAEVIGTVTKLNETTYDLGAEDGANLVVLRG